MSASAYSVLAMRPNAWQVPRFNDKVPMTAPLAVPRGVRRSGRNVRDPRPAGFWFGAVGQGVAGVKPSRGGEVGRGGLLARVRRSAFAVGAGALQPDLAM